MSALPGDQDPGAMNRRDFMVLSSLAAAWAPTGCATDPASGQWQLMLPGKNSESGTRRSAYRRDR